MANAKPSGLGRNDNEDKPKGESPAVDVPQPEKPKKDVVKVIKSWSEMVGKDGKKMRGSFKLGTTIITNS